MPTDTQIALLLEDEPHLAEALKIALNQLGMHTLHATTLDQAKKILRSERPDFVLLDRTLPDGDGLMLCTHLRKKGFKGPILMLTARSEVKDRVEGLDQGADEYLVKPFSWPEFEARVKVLIRRKLEGKGTSEAALWDLNEERLEVLGPKGWVKLTPLEFKLVRRLISSSGKIVQREDLLRNVWGFQLIPKTRTVDYFISRLRKYFENDPENPKHFLTVRGAGYQFEP